MASSSSSSSSSSSDIRIEVSDSKNSEDRKLHYKVELQRAIRRNDWNNLIYILEEFPAFKTEPITADGETVLILVAKQGKKSNFILKKLVREIRRRSDLTERDCRGSTALHAAAVVGDVVGAKTLLDYNPDLANISNFDGHLPFHVAVTHVHRDLMLFLLDVTAHDVRPYPFDGQPGAKLMCSLISSGFYDVALQLIDKYPTSAWDPDFSPLKAIAQEPTAFPSGVKLGFWKRLIYTC